MKTLLQSMTQGAMNTESGLTIQNRAKNHVFSRAESKVQLLKIENDPKQLKNKTYFYFVLLSYNIHNP